MGYAGWFQYVGDQKHIRLICKVDECKSLHYGHTAIILGAARVLKGMEAQLAGTVRLIFQPAEEGGAGALKMLDAGRAASTREGHVGRVSSV